MHLKGRIAAAGIGVALGGGCDPAGSGSDAGSGSGSACGPSEAVVARVIDGDTVELEGGLRVRYLLVDTPESTGGKMDCYGVEARDFNRDLVEGRTVTLEYDVECEDAYDRLLAYVEVDGREVNRLLVDRGLACVPHIEPNGQDRVAEFEQAEQAAKAGMVGMWGSCEEVTCE